jgi:hypothetical protein
MKSSLLDNSDNGSQSTGGKRCELPPMWFLAGAYVGACVVLLLGNWLMDELSSWTLGQIIGSLVFGAGLIVAFLCTAIEISGQAAMCCIKKNVRPRRQLFGYGMVFSILSVSVAIGITGGLGLAIDAVPLAGFRYKYAAYIAIGLSSVVLATAIVMRLFAFLCRRNKG